MNNVGPCSGCGANRILKGDICKRCTREGVTIEEEIPEE